LKGQEKEKHASAHKCSNCKTINEESAKFCRECGEQLDASFCPNCKAKTIPGGDICEICGEWLLPGQCRFCYSSITGSEEYCPECGNPTSGFTCPTCGTHGYFDFCKKCNTPLSESAVLALQQAQQNPEMLQLASLAKELEMLKKQTVEQTSLQKNMQETDSRESKEKAAKRAILLELEALKNSSAKSKPNPKPIPLPKPLFSEEDKKRLELSFQRKKDLEIKEKELLNRINEKSANQTFDTPQKARCYFSATKPAGNLIWECNYVHYQHQSSHECARPDLGGKWIIV